MITQFRNIAAALVAVAAASLFPVSASAQSEQQRLVNAADVTLSNFMRDPQMTWLQENIGRAKGVLIAPEIVRAGFIFGGLDMHINRWARIGLEARTNFDGWLVQVSFGVRF